MALQNIVKNIFIDLGGVVSASIFIHILFLERNQSFERKPKKGFGIIFPLNRVWANFWQLLLHKLQKVQSELFFAEKYDNCLSLSLTHIPPHTPFRNKNCKTYLRGFLMGHPRTLFFISVFSLHLTGFELRTSGVGRKWPPAFSWLRWVLKSICLLQLKLLKQ